VGELVDMKEAAQLLKTTRPTLYRWLRAGKVRGMKVGRQWRFYREDLERFLAGQAPRVDLPADMSPLIQTLQRRAEEAGAKVAWRKDLGEVQQAIRVMALLGLVTGASDIHITSHVPEDSAESTVALRYRVDGVLHEVAAIDRRLLPAVIEEWKRMAGCDTLQKEEPQSGRVVIAPSELEAAAFHKAIVMRVSFLPGALGESVAVRMPAPGAGTLELGRLGFSDHDRERLFHALRSPHGLIVITGPTGCGRTTTLYSCLKHIARAGINVATVEESIECLLPWVTQVPAHPSARLTMERAARAVLRSDPDVIMIDEIRSAETLGIAQEAALTGHLVLGALRSAEAAGALKKMADMTEDPLAVADSTELVLAQRLIRELCKDCSVEEVPDPRQLERVTEASGKVGLDWTSLTHELRKAVGCEKCAGTGYKGRTVVTETVQVTPEIADALRSKAPIDQLKAIALGQGTIPMVADGLGRAAAGETSLNEIVRVLIGDDVA